VDLPPRAYDLPEAFQESLSFPEQGWASLYVEAESIQLYHAQSDGSAMPILTGGQLSGLVSDSVPRYSFRFMDLVTKHDDVALTLRSVNALRFNFTLQAQDVRRVEYSNARTTCPATQDACLDGAKPVNLTAPFLGGYGGVVSHSVLEIAAPGGTLAGRGETVLIVAGGEHVSLAENGTARLPLATRTASCLRVPCLDPHAQTLRLLGNLTFDNFHASPGVKDRLAANLSGDFVAANLDETPVPTNLLGNFAAVAVTGGLGLAALLAWLFSRELTAESALRKPSRRATYAAVCAHPGATYRAIMRATGLSDGSTRLHLRKLEQVGLVVAQMHGRTVCYFENHGRYEKTWRTVLAAQEPKVHGLMAWLRQHPDRTQQEIVAYADGLGLTRRATQRRLKHLQAWGLLAVHRDGRAKRYRLLSEPTTLPPLASGGPSKVST
jgi:predicted transcriptional regulator